MCGLVAAADQKPPIQPVEELPDAHGIRLTEDLIRNRSCCRHALSVRRNGEMTDICPLRTQCLRDPPSRGAGGADECRLIAEFSPNAFALVDAQEVLARNARDLLFRSIGTGSGQHTSDLCEPLPRSCTAIGRQRCNAGHSAGLRKQAGGTAPEFVMHYNIQRCLRQTAQIRSGHITSQNGIHTVSRQRKEPHEFVRVVLPVVVGTRHADEIDGIRLPRTLLRQKCRKHGTCGLIPAIGKTP